MKTQVIDNSDLHFEHVHWKKELLFWEDEIRSFQNRLDEIVEKWTDDKVLAELGQFQNNFTIHKNKIDELKDEIDSHEHSMAIHLKANENVIDRVHYKYHIEFRDKMETQRKIYNDLKKRFFTFLSKYM
ncbi:hypothetical protein [Abyssalbus ytuae]|uniref:Uncharacterized protein n=1 Tax=Abyssalbus ytuae TaxID=2926907 RepID=A0A9E6ZUA7_9FLAO|nr:hypothetical protein [Abyssalbus ytuae]UOB17938.1 hypothetical protein MQE35_01245 [Abyssalbus ytuae]